MIARLALVGLLLFGAGAQAADRPKAKSPLGYSSAPAPRTIIRKNDWTRRLEVEQAGKRVATCRKSEWSGVIYCEGR